MISVIIPVYNPGESLIVCLESVINQTYKELEIICINDGSTDNSAEILAEYANKDTRITIISQNNQGVSVARNKGLAIATGEYISFIDSDDRLDFGMYEKLLELQSKYNECSIFHCGYKRVRLDGSTVDINGTGKIHLYTKEEALTHFLEGSVFNVGLWNKLFKRELLENVTFIPGLKINEDVLVCFQAFFKSNYSVYCDLPLYHYIEHRNSTCNTTNDLNRALDVVKVSKIMFETCEYTSLRITAGLRYFDSLCVAYRSYIFDNIRLSKKCRKDLTNEINLLRSKIGNLSLRRKFNYNFMHLAPRLYKAFYKIYNSIRVPNWDVK